jgi:hypothetical protein
MTPLPLGEGGPLAKRAVDEGFAAATPSPGSLRSPPPPALRERGFDSALRSSPAKRGRGTVRSMVEGAYGGGPLRLAALATSPACGGGTMAAVSGRP